MQGFNMGRYVPPDVEGTTAPSGNRLHHHKRPGAAAPPTVRFEMPFAVWCASCPQPTLIAQGVRFNAEKRRVGAYHTTPIWSFRIRHGPCGGALEMRTDPRNTAYVVFSGGSRRDDGGDAALHDHLDRQRREALRRDAFASLERTIEHREVLRRADERIVGLLEASHRHWVDPYAQNQRLRRAFRSGRRERHRDAEVAERLRDSMSLALELLPASQDDARRAALVDFGTAPLDDDDDDESNHPRATGRGALAKPLFAPAARSNKQKTRPRRASTSPSRPATSTTKDGLVSELLNKTRAAQDPFLWDSSANHHHLAPGRRCASPSLPQPPHRLGIKRKRDAGGAHCRADTDMSLSPATPLRHEASVATSLVQYDSD